MNCSGRGVLLESGQCECDPGWTSYGDMRAQTGLNCDVSTIFVRVVYSIPLVLFPFAVFHSSRQLYQLWDVKGWQKICRFSNKVFVIHVGTILSSIILSIAYIERIIFPEKAIGIDPLVTWLFFIGMTFFFIVMASTFELFVKISLKQESFGGNPSIIRLLYFARLLIPFLSVSMCSAFSLMIIAVYVRQVSVSAVEDLIIAFWVILGCAALLLMIATPITLHSACRDLDAMVRRHKSDGKAEDIVKLSKKLKGIRTQSIFRGMMNTTCFFLMGLWADARYWGPYVIGVQALAFSVIVLALATLTSTKSSGSSSTRASKQLTLRDSKEQIRSHSTNYSKSESRVESRDDDPDYRKSTTREETFSTKLPSPRLLSLARPSHTSKPGSSTIAVDVPYEN